MIRRVCLDIKQQWIINIGQVIVRIIFQRRMHIAQIILQRTVTAARIVQRFLILVVVIECQHPTAGTATTIIITVRCQRLSPADKQSAPRKKEGDEFV